jgi:hypothetical protein
VASVSAFDAGTAQALRAKLESFDGVEQAVVDENTLTILVHCAHDCEVTPLRKKINKAISETGADPEAANVILLTDLAARRRVKFSGIERIVERDNHVRIRVALEWEGETVHGEAVGENGDLIELRTAASASLNALERVLGEQLGIKLVGVKQVKAFDAELMVVALYRSGPPPQRLVGSVPTGTDMRRAAAIAVLNALNRLLGNYLSV